MNIRKWNLWNRADRIPETYGALIALALVTYFFIMYAVGLVHHVEFRFLNIAFMIAGIRLALRQYKRTHDGHLNYFRGLAVGVSAGSIGVSIFAAFMVFYLKIDQGLMATIIEYAPMGQYINEYTAAVVIMSEGIFSVLAVTYILLNWVETDNVASPAG